MKKALFALCLLSAPAATVSAQTYSVDWFSVDGGGGTSTGAVYSVNGSIGEPDAGTMTGGGYSLVGGFWGIVSVVQTSGAPLLSIERQPSGVRVYWPNPSTGFVLDQSPSVTGLWSQVTAPYQTNASDISIDVTPVGNKFYRLRKP